jgi:hypothetical protein
MASGGRMILTLDANGLASEDVDDLVALFAVMERTLRRVVAASGEPASVDPPAEFVLGNNALSFATGISLTVSN